MLNAITANNADKVPTTQGLASALPNALPVSAETTPSGVKSAAMPNTNEVDRSAAYCRLSACLAPNTLTVIAIIGYTQGVNEVARPATKISPSAPSVAPVLKRVREGRCELAQGVGGRMRLGHQSRDKPHQTDPRTIAHAPTMVLVWLTVHEPGT